MISAAIVDAPVLAMPRAAPWRKRTARRAPILPTAKYNKLVIRLKTSPVLKVFARPIRSIHFPVKRRAKSMPIMNIPAASPAWLGDEWNRSIAYGGIDTINRYRFRAIKILPIEMSVKSFVHNLGLFMTPLGLQPSRPCRNKGTSREKCREPEAPEDDRREVNIKGKTHNMQEFPTNNYVCPCE